MNAEQLKAVQPVAMQILENAIDRDRISHAYLFQGPKGTYKKEAAKWLIGEIINKHSDKKMHKDNLRRVEEESYADMIILDGTVESIKKDDIVNLQVQFSNTALEAAGVKCYILNQIDNASAAACNSLLKFLEEPSSDTYAILITDKQDNVLPTLISRCQVISFKSLPFEQCFRDCLDKGMDLVDSYCLSSIVHNSELAYECSEKEAYQSAIALVKSFVKDLVVDPGSALINVQMNGYIDKNKQLEREIMNYFVDILILFYRDCLAVNENITGWYKEAVELTRNKNVDICALEMILLESKDKINNVSFNLELIMDETIIKMKEVLQWKN